MKKAKTVVTPKSKLEQLRDKALALVAKVRKYVKQNPRRVLLAVGVGIILSSVVSTVRAERDATYELRIFASTIAGPVLLDNLTVKGVSHKADGSVCFREELQTRTAGCLKVDLYILKRSE